jgi:hypothetical protein
MLWIKNMTQWANQNFHTNGHKNYDTENLDKKKFNLCPDNHVIFMSPSKELNELDFSHKSRSLHQSYRFSSHPIPKIPTPLSFNPVGVSHSLLRQPLWWFPDFLRDLSPSGRISHVCPSIHSPRSDSLSSSWFPLLWRRPPSEWRGLHPPLQAVSKSDTSDDLLSLSPHPLYVYMQRTHSRLPLSGTLLKEQYPFSLDPFWKHLVT